MAGRDQAARILRSEPETRRGAASGAPPHPRMPRRCAPCWKTRRRCSSPIRRNPRSTCRPQRRPARRRGRGEIRQAEMRPARRRHRRARRDRILRHRLHAGRPLHGRHRRRLCARQQHHARRPRRRPYRGDPAGDNAEVKAGDVVFRIDDGDYSIAVRCRARQDRHPAGDDRPHRPPDHRAGQRGGAGAGATDSAEAAAKRASLDFDRQQSLSTKGFASRAMFEMSQAGRDQSAAAVSRRQAALTPRATMSKSPRRSRTKPAPSSPNCRARSPRPSATSTSPMSARRSTASSPTAWSISATTSRPASGSPTSCRSTTSISTPTSRRRSCAA